MTPAATAMKNPPGVGRRINRMSSGEIARPGAKTHTIDARGLKKSYGGKAVVEGIDMSVRTGEIVGLLGPNGAGKTTIFYMITGIVNSDAGAITLDGLDIAPLPMYRRARRGIGYLPQEPSVFRRLSVRNNLRAVLELKGFRGDRMEERTEKLLDEFNLRAFQHSMGFTLSGGQRRRTEIARAIASDPTFILFDEPFAGIDPIAIIELKKMITYLKEKGIGILITDHNVRETLSITDRAYIISHGKVLDEGTPEKITGNLDVKRAYLGEDFTI
jgi:lipopolysaccharide export system ATP-binding protein